MSSKFEMKWKSALAACIVFTAGLAANTVSMADSKDKIDQGVNDTLKEFYSYNTEHADLANKAAGMLVFPHVTKGGVGIAGEHGEGVLQVKGKTVDYYSVSAGSVGVTLGLATHSEIIMFMTMESLNKFTQSKGWTIGADTGITVVSKGASAQYDTQTLKKPILGFVFNEKGLIGDLSLEGSKISKIDK